MHESIGAVGAVWFTLNRREFVFVFGKFVLFWISEHSQVSVHLWVNPGAVRLQWECKWTIQWTKDLLDGSMEWWRKKQQSQQHQSKEAKVNKEKVRKHLQTPNTGMNLVSPHCFFVFMRWTNRLNGMNFCSHPWLIDEPRFVLLLPHAFLFHK